MSAGRLARGLGTILGLVVAGTAGFYMVVYLARWEWTRALVSGVIFLAAEVALAVVVVLNRLRGLEARLERGPSALPERMALQSARPLPSSPFAWLKDDGKLSVFVPVLMGAGVLLSAMAFVVQRVAEWTSRATLEPATARDLAALAPRSGLVPGHGAPPPPLPPMPAPAARRASAGQTVLTVLAVAATAVLVWLAIDRIGDATQTRPHPLVEEETLVFLDVKTRRGQESASAAAQALWVACEARLPSASRLHELVPVADDGALLVLRPGLTEQTWREFRGCLEDLTLNRISANATRVTR